MLPPIEGPGAGRLSAAPTSFIANGGRTGPRFRKPAVGRPKRGGGAFLRAADLAKEGESHGTAPRLESVRTSSRRARPRRALPFLSEHPRRSPVPAPRAPTARRTPQIPPRLHSAEADPSPIRFPT